MVAFITIAGLVAGIITTRFFKPEYVAQSTIWIDQDGRLPGGSSDNMQDLRPNRSFDAAAWADLVVSYQVLDTVVHDLGLNVEFEPGTDSAFIRGFAVAPTFRPGSYRIKVANGGWALSDDGREIDHGTVADSIGRSAGFQWMLSGPVKDDASARLSLATEREAARHLSQNLIVHVNTEGNFLRLELGGKDPQRIATILNAVDRRYVAVAADLRRQKLTETRRVLAAQLADASTQLRNAERAFEAQRVHNITLPEDAESNPGVVGFVDPKSAPPATYFNLQNERDEIRRTRAALDRVALAPGTGPAIPTPLDAIPAVKQDAELRNALAELDTARATLRTLSYRYADDYPPVSRMRQEVNQLETKTVPALAAKLSAALAQRDREITAQMATHDAALRAMPPRAVEESHLRRNVEIAGALFTSMQERYDAARVADESSTAGVRVLDGAVAPDTPDTNNGNRILLVALLCGLALGLGYAVTSDRIDPRVRYPEQVSSEMGLAILGALPHRDAARGSAAIARRDGMMHEALRAIRLNVAYAHGGAGPITFTVTSPGSADGKSFLASNLARTFASNGQRTVIVDGDLRRGVLHRDLDLPRRPGLADYLAGNAELGEVVHRTKIDGLDLVPSGTRAGDAPELLARAATMQLLASLRSRYEVVIFDSPPLTAGIDAFVLGVATGNLLVVLRTGVSDRDDTNAKLDMLDRMPVRLLGAVLNDVRDTPVYSAYSYYLPGYEAADEQMTTSGAPGVLS
jgi:tyrosine-protein kinase Etk/Wzc